MTNELDIVLPLGTGSRWGDNELKYALRAIEKNLTGYRHIFIVGKPRKWLQGVIYIDAEELYTQKQLCIFNKVIKACEHPAVSETFAFWNDDHILLRPLHVTEIKNWKSSTLKHLAAVSDGMYRAAVAHTLKRCTESLWPGHNFDIHVPILYEKDRFLKLKDEDWRRDHVIKSLYGNRFNLPAEDLKDLNFGKPMTEDEILTAIDGRPFFSFNEKALNAALSNVLERLFPEKSKYEK